MSYIAHTRASTIFPLVGFLERAGASVERLLAMADLPSSVSSDSEALIPARGVCRLFNAAARELDIPNFGFIVGEQTNFDTLGTFGRVARRAPTLGTALQTVKRCYPMFTSGSRIWLRRRGDVVEFRRALIPELDPQDFAWQQNQLHVLGRMLAFVRLAAGPSWRPAEVHLQTDEAPALRDAESLAGARVAFRQPATMIAIPRALLAAPLPPPLRIEAPGDAVEEWERSRPARDFVRSVRQAIETLSCRDYPDVRATADFVDMSVRTLQRRLSAAGVSHDLLVAQARFATAAAVLEETDAKILDLALDLGYSDHANFTRAFRRWTGCSPREYRLRRGGGSVPRSPSSPRGGAAASAPDHPMCAVSSRVRRG
jgi:AraC-like DNA-binding protein